MNIKIAGTWIITLILFIIGLWPIALLGIYVSLYITVKNLTSRQSSKEAEELEQQRNIEQKEVDMVRKSNEILLHLIQDEHREEGR